MTIAPADLRIRPRSARSIRWCGFPHPKSCSGARHVCERGRCGGRVQRDKFVHRGVSKGDRGQAEQISAESNLRPAHTIQINAQARYNNTVRFFWTATKTEASMRQILTIAGAALVMLAHCEVGIAQVGMAPGSGTTPAIGATPGMGMTSPLGSLLSSAPSLPGGNIPLGATELDSGGLSPTASTAPCSSTATTSPQTVGSNSTFDGGGSISIPTISTSCASGASGSPGMATSTTAGSTITGLAPGSTGVGVPLGSTELGTPGESPAIVAPSVACSGISPTTGTLGTSGTSAVPSTNSC
jgi:hypothetical protein